jgi:hypothetical protein
MRPFRLSVKVRRLQRLALLAQSRVLPIVGSKHCGKSVRVVSGVTGLFLASVSPISVEETQISSRIARHKQTNSKRVKLLLSISAIRDFVLDISFVQF